jgi:hypothetical protein
MAAKMFTYGHCNTEINARQPLNESAFYGKKGENAGVQAKY